MKKILMLRAIQQEKKILKSLKIAKAAKKILRLILINQKALINNKKIELIKKKKTMILIQACSLIRFTMKTLRMKSKI